MMDPRFAPPVDPSPEARQARIAAGDAASTLERFRAALGLPQQQVAAEVFHAGVQMVLLETLARQIHEPGRRTSYGMAYGWVLMVEPDGSWQIAMV